MNDELSSPGERLWSAMRRLHPVTVVLLAAMVVSLVADLFGLVSVLIAGRSSEPMQMAGYMTQVGRQLAYTAGYLGSAASVEYLFRIWREVKAIRERG